MTTKTDYNGWPNRATWNVALWVGNDRGMYDARRDYLERDQRWTDWRAESFSESVFPTGITPDGEKLSDVHWPSIAEAWNEEL